MAGAEGAAAALPARAARRTNPSLVILKIRKLLVECWINECVCQEV